LGMQREKHISNKHTREGEQINAGTQRKTNGKSIEVSPEFVWWGFGALTTMINALTQPQSLKKTATKLGNHGPKNLECRGRKGLS